MNIRKPFLAKKFIFNWWDFMKTYIWTRSWTIRASKSIFYVSINCYSLFTNSRQRLKYSRDFFWTKWRSACYVIIILPSPKQKLYWVEFQRRFEVLLWSCWTNFEIKRSKCIVFLFYWVVKTLFLKNFIFSLDFPFNSDYIFWACNLLLISETFPHKKECHDFHYCVALNCNILISIRQLNIILLQKYCILY